MNDNQLMSLAEVRLAISEHQRAQIRDFIRRGEDGNEYIDLQKMHREGALRFVKSIEIADGQIVEIALTNGQRAKRGEFVYLMRADNGLTKIGLTDNLDRRVKSLQSSSPVEINLIGYIKTATAEMLEGELHNQFSKWRAHGEWFSLTDEQCLQIISEHGGVWDGKI